jgi:predicted phage tail protein
VLLGLSVKVPPVPTLMDHVHDAAAHHVLSPLLYSATFELSAASAIEVAGRVIAVVTVGLSMVGAVPKTIAPEPVFVLIVVPRKTRLVLKYPVLQFAPLDP